MGIVTRQHSIKTLNSLSTQPKFHLTKTSMDEREKAFVGGSSPNAQLLIQSKLLTVAVLAL